MTVRLFLDTEWADEQGRELVSLALVSEDGQRVFYAERKPLPGWPTDWVSWVVYRKKTYGRRLVALESFEQELVNDGLDLMQGDRQAQTGYLAEPLRALDGVTCYEALAASGRARAPAHIFESTQRAFLQIPNDLPLVLMTPCSVGASIHSYA